MLVIRRLSTSLALLFVVACASATPRQTLNKYGLHVVGTIDEYLQSIRMNDANTLIDLDAAVPAIRLEIHYATADNFMKRPLYPVARAFLRKPAALALEQVQSDLAARGLGLKVFDGYRPYRVTEAMWEPYKNPDFVADPAKGSRHNRGAAVDLTLVDLGTGDELAMPTPYDAFTPRAAQSFADLPAEVIANRALLRKAMERRGFEPLASEWWHFDYSGWRNFELMDIPLEEIPAAGSHP